MLPQIRSLRTSSLQIGGKLISINPWTNRNVLRYEYAKEIIDKKIAAEADMPIFEKKLLFMEAIFSYLVKPNIDYDGFLSQFEKEVLFIEMYKISRGTIIELSYECPKCKGHSVNNFNVDAGFTFSEAKVGSLTTKDATFNLAQSTFNEDELDDIDPSEHIVFYYCSFVKDFEYKGHHFVIQSLTEFSRWMLDELDEINFNEFISKISGRTPSISIKGKVGCDYCGFEEDVTFLQLPDFSLVTL